MDKEQLNQLMGSTFTDIRNMREQKALEYTPQGDQLGNFKRCSKILEVMPERVLLGFLIKHWDSINQLVGILEAGHTPPVEMWKEKLHDNILYSVLLLALLKERYDEVIPKKSPPQPPVS